MNGATSSEDSTRRGLGAAIWSQLFLRIAGSAGVLVIGGYFVELQDNGLPITSVLVGVVTGLIYLTELLLAPPAGALSDGVQGRKRFLLAGPLLAAFAVLLPPLGSLISTLPSMALVVGLLVLARLIEGLGSAASVPATLGFLSEGTDQDPLRRGRQMGFYELAASGGVAIGAVLGPLLWSVLHLFAFVALSIIYLTGAAFVLFGVRDAPSIFRPRSLFNPCRYLEMLSDRRLTLFVPAWIVVNAILGVWVQAQIVFVLAGSNTVPGQRFVGSLYNREQELSLILFAYVLWFSICVVAWAFLLGRLSRLPTLLVTLFGAIVASFGLISMNHGGAYVAFVPVVMAGVFLEAGFVPAALAYLADVSEDFAGERGMLMGLYSLVLGLGYLLGNLLGGVAAQAAYFDGLAYLTMILAAVGMLSLGVLVLSQRRRS